VVVINTCSVRDGAENKLYSRLGEIRAAGLESGHDPVVPWRAVLRNRKRARFCGDPR
jgi:hypothetical protein